MTDDFKLIIGKLMHFSIGFKLIKDTVANIWVLTNDGKITKWEVDDVDEFNGFPNINFYSCKDEFSSVYNGDVDGIIHKIYVLEHSF